MQSIYLSNTTDYSTYSKEALLNIIEKLQQESRNSQKDNSTLSNGGEMSFRQKYAEQILDALPDMLTVITDDGTTVAMVSSKESNHFGITHDNICGTPINAFLPEHVCEHVMESIKQAIEFGKSTNLNHLMYVDGKPHYFENRTVRIRDNRNLCLYRDITEETLAKMQLESLSYAVDLVNENIFSLNLSGEFIFVNKQFLEDHKQNKSIIGKSAIGVILGCPNLDSWEELKRDINNNNGELNYTIDSYDFDNNKFSYEVIVNSIRNINNEEEFWFFAKNITVRLEQELKIKELNNLMDAILSNIPIYLFVKDTTNFKYLYWNKAIADLMGLKAEKAIGFTDYEIFSNNIILRKFMANEAEILSTNKPIEYIENIVDINNEERVLKAMKIPICRDGKKPLIIGVALDITDIKLVEKELIAAKIEAEKSNQLKSAFLANMSHEIRTPLNAIVGFAKLIMTEEDLDARQEYSDIIDRNADLLLQLINDILDLSKIEAGMLDFVINKINLDELCRDMYEIHRMKMLKDVTLIYEGGDSELIIESDRNRLAQVFTNLISNAIKFTNSGEIRFGYKVNGDKIEAFVRDTGIGISAEELPAIFDRFIKLNNFITGTGLGLSIVKTIIERLGGDISAKSEEGKGTEFKFYIPYKNKITLSTPKDIGLEMPINGTPIKKSDKCVLIVEDTDSNYLLVNRFLKSKYGYENYHAHNGEEAVKLFLEHSPRLIFMDIKMPVMDGLEAARIIRSHSADVPIIALSAFAYEGDKKNAIDAGCNYFLTKPLAFDQVQQILDKYLR